MPEAFRKKELRPAQKSEKTKHAKDLPIPESKRGEIPGKQVEIKNHEPVGFRAPDFKTVATASHEYFKNLPAINAYLIYLDAELQKKPVDLSHAELPNGQTFAEIGWGIQDAKDLLGSLKAQAAKMEERGRIGSLRKEMGIETASAESAIAQARATLESNQLSEANLERAHGLLLEANERLHAAQAELMAQTPSPEQRTQLDANLKLIRQIEAFAEITQLDPETAKQEYEEVGLVLAAEENATKLAERRMGLEARQKELIREIARLKKAMADEGAYGEDVKAEELLHPSGGYFTVGFKNLKNNLTDFFRRSRNEKPYLSELRAKMAELAPIEAELESTARPTETVEQIAALRVDARPSAKARAAVARGRGEVRSEAVRREQRLAVEKPSADALVTQVVEAIDRKKAAAEREQEQAQQGVERAIAQRSAHATEVNRLREDLRPALGDTAEVFIGEVDAIMGEDAAAQVEQYGFTTKDVFEAVQDYLRNAEELRAARDAGDKVLAKALERKLKEIEKQIAVQRKALRLTSDPFAGTGKSRLKQTRAIGSPSLARESLQTAAYKTVGKTVETTKKPHRTTESSEASAEIVQPIDREEALRLVPNAAHLWNIAAAGLGYLPDEDRKRAERRMNGFQKDQPETNREAPQTKLIFELARYQKAIQLNADAAAVENIKYRVDDVAKQLHIDNLLSYRRMSDQAFQEAYLNLPDLQHELRLMQTRQHLPAWQELKLVTEKSDGTTTEVVLREQTISKDTRDAFVAINDYVNAIKAKNNEAAKDALRRIDALEERVGGIKNRKAFHSVLRSID